MFIRNCQPIFQCSLHHFAFPPSMNQHSCCSISLPAFGVISVFDFSHSNSCAMGHILISENLQFPDNVGYCASFHMLICHCCLSFYYHNPCTASSNQARSLQCLSEYLGLQCISASSEGYKVELPWAEVLFQREDVVGLVEGMREQVKCRAPKMGNTHLYFTYSFICESHNNLSRQMLLSPPYK